MKLKNPKFIEVLQAWDEVPCHPLPGNLFHAVQSAMVSEWPTITFSSSRMDSDSSGRYQTWTELRIEHYPDGVYVTIDSKLSE